MALLGANHGCGLSTYKIREGDKNSAVFDAEGLVFAGCLSIHSATVEVSNVTTVGISLYVICLGVIRRHHPLQQQRRISYQYSYRIEKCKSGWLLAVVRPVRVVIASIYLQQQHLFHR